MSGQNLDLEGLFPHTRRAIIRPVPCEPGASVSLVIGSLPALPCAVTSLPIATPLQAGGPQPDESVHRTKYLVVVERARSTPHGVV